MTPRQAIAAIRDLLAFAREEHRIELDSYGVAGGTIDDVDDSEERERIEGDAELIEQADAAVSWIEDALVVPDDRSGDEGLI